MFSESENMKTSDMIVNPILEIDENFLHARIRRGQTIFGFVLLLIEITILVAVIITLKKQGLVTNGITIACVVLMVAITTIFLKNVDKLPLVRKYRESGLVECVVVGVEGNNSLLINYGFRVKLLPFNPEFPLCLAKDDKHAQWILFSFAPKTKRVRLPIAAFPSLKDFLSTHVPHLCVKDFISL